LKNHNYKHYDNEKNQDYCWNTSTNPIIIKAPPPIVTSLVVTMDIKEEKIIIAMPKNIKEKPIMNNLEFIFSPYFKESH